MKKIILVVIILFFVSVVSAQINWETADCSTIKENSTTFELFELTNSSNVFKQLNGEILNLTVFRRGSPFVASGKVESSVMTEFSCSHRQDATLSVYIQQDAIEKIRSSDNQFETIMEMRNNGGIKIEAHNFIAELKIGIYGFIADVSYKLGFTNLAEILVP